MPETIDFQIRFAREIAARQPPAEKSPAAFAVYRNTWLKGLLDALDANYPTVAMLLGPELFREVAVDYARAHPPNSPVLARYGETFAEFLEGRLGDHLPYLRDVAALERLWTESFFAADAPTLSPEHYAKLRPAELLGLRTGLHPAARIARFETPAVTIWQAHRNAGDFEQIEPDWQAERVLVARRGPSVVVRLLDDAAYRILLEIRSGRTIGAAVARAADACASADLATALTNILESGALTGGAEP